LAWGIFFVEGLNTGATEKERGDNCGVISSAALYVVPSERQVDTEPDTSDKLLSILKRRPCTLEQMPLAPGLKPNEVLRHIDSLYERGVVGAERKGVVSFFESY